MPLDFPLPEHCSLLQAALWVSRGQRPVPDGIFEAAPLTLDEREIAPDGPLRPLIQALRGGAIPARATWHLYTAPHPGDSNWKSRHFSGPKDVPPHAWSWSDVNWQDSDLEKDFMFLYKVYMDTSDQDLDEIEEFGRISLEAQKSGEAQSLILSQVQISTVELCSIFNTNSMDQPVFHRTESLSSQSYTPPYLAFMLQACQKLGLSSDRRVTKQEIEVWIRENWPRALGQPSNSKVEYMSTFLRHPEDEKGGYHRPMRKA